MNKQINIPKAFIGFFITSFLMWLLINLSKEYTSVVSYKIKYGKLPQDKILQEEPIKEIDFLVKASGFNLLSANFSDRKIELLINKLNKKTKNDYYFLTSKQKSAIQKQLKSGLSLQGVLQDTIYLKLGVLATKKVPVVSNLDIKYALGYDIDGKELIKPDSVLISGPELQLSKISQVSLAKLSLEDISKNVKEVLPIVIPQENMPEIKLSHDKAEVNVIVDKFTEGELEVPVSVSNISAEKKLNIYPKKVKVVFKVGLKHFNKITADSFEIVCDYREAKKNELTYLIPKLVSTPKDVSSVRIVPNRIDFLIHK